MSEWQLESMRRMVALLLRNGVEPACELIGRTLQLDPEIVRAEVVRKTTNVPPNTEMGCEGK
jgi:hypothetical protein